MASANQIPHLIVFIFIFIIIFFLNVKLLRVDSVDGKENEIEKVSGEHESGEKRFMIVGKLRLLLGLKSFRIRDLNGHIDQGLLSPSPAPAPTPVPTLKPMARTHLHSHHSSPRWKFSPMTLHHQVHLGRRKKDGDARMVVLVSICSGIAFVIAVLGLIFFCWKSKRSRQRRSMVKISGPDDKCGKSKYVNSSESKSYVIVDLAPQQFYLNSLAPISEAGASGHLDASKLTTMSSFNAYSQVEEVHSVEKTSICENTSLANDNAPAEPFLSDDESFHSVCGSCSSNARISDASDGDLSNTTEVCSPQISEQVMASRPSQKSSNHIHSPPLPPLPPPPLVNFFQSKSAFNSKNNKSTASSFKLPTISSTQNTSSSTSNSIPQNDLPPSPQHKQVSASQPQRIPPPPTPPPSFKERSNCKQVPPPPPDQFPQLAPVGKDGSPLPKLKPLHWDKVRAGPDCSTIWDKMKSSSFEFDEQMIESLFGYNMQIKNDEAKSKTPSPSKHILEPKRRQNLTILLKALNATPEQVCDALMQGDGLRLQQLEVLTKMVPTKEEATKLLNYQEDSNDLDSVERFIRAMLSVPFAFTRIDAMLYRDTFEDEVVHLRKSFAMLEEACKELRSSRLFLKLLDAVLKTGNRMNVGTIRGGAKAFKLDALLKLADVKGTDGKTTLLHFVVQEVIRSEEIRESGIITKKSNQKTKDMTLEEREEDYRRLGLDLVSSLCTELCNVKKTATIDLDIIASSVSTLSDGMFKLQRLVHDASSIEQNSHFVQSMQSFLNKAEKNIKELQKDEDQVLLHVKDITEYFHGHVAKNEVNPLRIFVIVRDFLGMLDQVCKELRTLKITHTPNSSNPFR